MSPGWLAVGALVVLPPALILAAGARFRWLAGGVLSWGIALVLKSILLLFLYPGGKPALPTPYVAVAHGFLSALAELGIAALFLRRRRLPWPDVLAFGIGIGAFEVLWVLMEGSLELVEARAFTRANMLAIVSGTFLIERAITLVGHTASRVLLYVAQDRRALLPAMLCVALFTLVDGVAVYGWLAGWNWENPRVWGGFYLFLAAVGAVEAVAAWHFAQQVPWQEYAAGKAAPSPFETTRTGES